MDKPIYIDTYFRIESGYEWGRGMSKEKTEAFFSEIKKLFSQNGFAIEERKHGRGYIRVYKSILKFSAGFSGEFGWNSDMVGGCVL